MEEERERLMKAYYERDKKYKESEKIFWDIEYPKKSVDEKVTFWTGNIHRQMRWNGESGFDEMAIFSRKNYESWKNLEPNFDVLLPEIIKKLGSWVSSEEVYRKIKGE